MEIFGAILFILGLFIFLFSFLYLAEEDSIIGFSLIAIAGVSMVITGASLAHNTLKEVKEYSVIYSETYTSDHGHLYEFVIEDKNGSCSKIIITEDEAKLYYRNNKFFISDRELKELKGE